MTLDELKAKSIDTILYDTDYYRPEARAVIALFDERDKLAALVMAMAERIAIQSELLSQRAEKRK